MLRIRIEIRAISGLSYGQIIQRKSGWQSELPRFFIFTSIINSLRLSIADKSDFRTIATLNGYLSGSVKLTFFFHLMNISANALVVEDSMPLNINYVNLTLIFSHGASSFFITFAS